MKIIYYCALFAAILLYGASSVFSTPITEFDSVIIAVSAQDHNFIRYFYYKNLFDSGQTSYRFGEVKMHDNNGMRRVHLSSLLQDNKFIQGDSAQGEMQNLLEYSRTENFVIPSSGKISYFGLMQAVGLPCGGINIPSDSNEFGNCSGFSPSAAPDYWAVGKGKITDRTEFVLQLMRASDDEVLATLDSVGVAPNSDCIFAKYYGAEVGLANHWRQLPETYSNTLAYLRMSARRYGPTPYGITMLNDANDFLPQSCYRDSVGTVKVMTAEKHKAFWQGYVWNKISNYYDSVANATGEYPHLRHAYIMNGGIDTLFNNKYLDKHYRPDSTFYFTAKPYSLAKNTSNVEPYFFQSLPVSGLKEFSIKGLHPNPNNGTYISLRVSSLYDVRGISAILYSAEGANMGMIWRGNLQKGENDIIINFNARRSGSYYVNFLNGVGQVVDYDKFIVEK